MRKGKNSKLLFFIVAKESTPANCSTKIIIYCIAVNTPAGTNQPAGASAIIKTFATIPVNTLI